MYEDLEAMVKYLNSIDASWKAEIFQDFIGLTLKETNQRAGKKSPIRSQPPPIQFIQFQQSPLENLSMLKQKDYNSVIAFYNTPISQIPTSALPTEWDWTDINGVNYVPAPRQQGQCGSCYAITTAEMIESRLRILTNNQFQQKLSIQYLISCSFYTEGCDGGYPSLLGKFVQEFNLVDEKCFPYQEENIKCKKICNSDEIQAIVSLKSFYLIGGYYGATDEENMLKELRTRGPIITNFEPGPGFTTYKSGVYSSGPWEQAEDVINNRSMRDQGLDWEKVDHSVLIVGYGETASGQKYWKCLNSWGDSWGENGFFRIQRGTDESAIESYAEAGIPEVLYS